MHYAPEEIFEDAFGKNRMYNEMWTAKWWCDIQVSCRGSPSEVSVSMSDSKSDLCFPQKLLPDGATVTPVILASDKTQLSTFSGDKTAWPVYLSIGNIAKATRRSPSLRATVLIGYLPVAKLEVFSEKKCSLFGYQLFHDCMRSLLKPLVEAGTKGVDMVCSDGFIRTIYPIVAAYIADHQEPCLVACCQENQCPKCLVEPKQRGSTLHSLLRDSKTTAAMLQEAVTGEKPAGFKDAGLRAVYPFWLELPQCDIFACMTPDILHQLQQSWTVPGSHFICTRRCSLD